MKSSIGADTGAESGARKLFTRLSSCWINRAWIYLPADGADDAWCRVLWDSVRNSSFRSTDCSGAVDAG